MELFKLSSFHNPLHCVASNGRTYELDDIYVYEGDKVIHKVGRGWFYSERGSNNPVDRIRIGQEVRFRKAVKLDGTVFIIIRPQENRAISNTPCGTLYIPNSIMRFTLKERRMDWYFVFDIYQSSLEPKCFIHELVSFIGTEMNELRDEFNELAGKLSLSFPNEVEGTLNQLGVLFGKWKDAKAKADAIDIHSLAKEVQPDILSTEQKEG